MSFDSNVDAALLARYLSEECDAAESARVEQWLAADPAHHAELAVLRRAWTLVARQGDAVDTKAAWRGLSARLSATTVPGSELEIPLVDAPVVRAASYPAPHRARTTWHWGIGAAAAAVVLTGVGLLSHFNDSASRHRSVATMRTLTAPLGQRTSLDLPDGTRIVLAPGTQLRYDAAAFAATAARERVMPRRVDLDGEAIFTVAHDVTRPFTVHTARDTVQVLGTRFGVRALRKPNAGSEAGVSDRDTAIISRVIVGEGRVSLGRVVLSPNDQAVRAADGTLVITRNVSADALLAWADGQLVFTQTPVRDVLHELSRWYDLDFICSDRSAGDRLLTATFDADSLTDANLARLATLLHMSVTRRGRTVRFENEHAPSASRHRAAVLSTPSFK